MRRIGFVLIFFLCLCACSSAEPLLPDEIPLRIHFLDAGQGDCILLRTHEGDILIDAGAEYAEDRICLRLAQLGVQELRLAIFTHPDEDHIGGADGILSRIPAREVWMSQPKRESPNESEERLFDAAEQCGARIVTASAGTHVSVGGVTFFVLSPDANEVGGTNETCIVLKLICKEASAIFTGDLDAGGELRLIETYGSEQLASQLCKVGHHGSSSSSTKEWISAVSPQWAVISCERGNEYGHPHGEVISRWESSGVSVLRTDRDGEIVFECDGKEIRPINMKKFEKQEL